MMKVVLLRGTSGSGKSTYIKEHYPNAIVCSADHYFMKDGEYKFNPTLLPEAHKFCLRKFIACIEDATTTYGPNQFFRAAEIQHLVVDNTNTQLWEISPYLSIAQAYGLEVEIVHCVCSPQVATERNAHGVPLKTIEAMAKRFEKLMPWWPKEIVVNTGE
jgi:predicted kinase